MKKNYNFLGLLTGLLMATGASQIRAQYLIPYSGDNSIPAGSGLNSLCSHAGCGNTYNSNAGGYTVIYPSSCFGTTITGSYDIESCCDDIYIYDGVGTGGTQLANYFGNGTFNYVGTPGQTLTIAFFSDGSVEYSGLQATVDNGVNLTVNGGVTDYTVCSGTSLNLVASGVDTYTWNASTISNAISVTPLTTTSYTVEANSNLVPSCTMTQVVNVLVNQTPVISISGNTVICGPGTTDILNVNGNADTYYWSNGSTGQNISINPLQATTYSVIGTITQGGCMDTAYFQVAFSLNPVVSIFSNKAEICAGASVNMFGIGADTFTWSTNSNSSQINVSPTVTTIYTLIGSNSYGCTGQSTVQIIVDPKPNVSGTPNPATICWGEQSVLSGGGAVDYEWSSNTIFLQSPSILVSPNQTTTYTVKGTDVNGCSNKTTVVVNVNLCTGLNEGNSILSHLSVYPNPANNVFTIETGSTVDKTVEVIDLTGRLILSTNSNDAKTEVNISTLAKGIYYVKIKSGVALETVKMVKE